MRKKKHQFHCQKCNNPLEIYKKGKGHRLLVCPHCGILANNPGLMGSVVKRLARGALGEIPGASLIMEGAGLVGDVLGSKKEETKTPSVHVHKNAYTTEEKVRDALR